MAEELEKGTVLSDPAVPGNPDAATHHAKYGVGGWQTGRSTIAERNAITLERRQWWMVVPTDDGKKWELVPGLASQNLTDNNNWREWVAAAAPYNDAALRGRIVDLEGKVSVLESTVQNYLQRIQGLEARPVLNQENLFALLEAGTNITIEKTAGGKIRINAAGSTTDLGEYEATEYESTDYLT